MKKLYASPDLVAVNELHDLLEAEGIPCLVKNEIGATWLVGAIPVNESTPEVWLEEDAHEERARQILGTWLAPAASATRAWVCPSCGEPLEGQFQACWKCGKVRD